MRSQKSVKNIIGFRGKIILIVVGILSLSYSLGMFLSVLSFEKIYLKALTSKYEILGKDLKHKIETALKFGKRLDGFVGMENLVKPLYAQSEDISEIFNPFVSSKTSGAGMGLSKAYLLVEEHRGTLSVTSQPNKGSVFEVVLPVDRFVSGMAFRA